MSAVNKAIILGNLGRDPELRHTSGGDPVCNLNVATSESWKDRNSGERKERTEWHRVTIWGALADVAAKHLRKGSKVYLEGKIETRKWQDQQGQDKYTTEIVLRGYGSQLVMLDGKPPADDKSDSGYTASDYAKASRGGGDLDDEIPF